MSTTSFTQRAAVVVLLALIASGAQAQPVLTDGVLTDAAGRTLYTFDKDQTNKSNCAGNCLQNWPAYVAEPSATAKPIQGLSRFEQNGVQQWSWNGHPLYYFAGDAKAGDRNGDGKGGMWHVVKPAMASTPSGSGYSY